MCHNDLAAWNLIVRCGALVAWIDFDDAAPCNRVDGLAYFLWTFVLNDPTADSATQLPRLVAACDAYGSSDHPALLPVIETQRLRIVDRRRTLARSTPTPASRKFSALRVQHTLADLAWLGSNRAHIEV